jgi:L-alanine-DL-glutamate epimerase-like enolase superfamily enzyme
MKITDVRTTVLESRYDRPIKFAHMDLTSRFIVLVEVMTDQGIVGLADIDGFPAGDLAVVPLVENTFKPLLLGMDATQRGAIYDRLFEVVHRLGRYQSLESYVLGAIDTALWDIAGKAAGQPISQLLGARRSTVSVYASLGKLASEQIGAEVERAAADGFAGVKIRIGFPGEDEIDLVSRARTALASDRPPHLMADVNSGWLVPHAIQSARALEKFDLYWLEEPLMPWSLDASARLAAAIDIPIALGEHELFNRYDARRIVDCSAADILQPDLRQGITECLRIAHLAEAAGLPCVPHFFGPAVRFAAMLQLLGAIDNYLVCEYPTAYDPIRFELTDPPMVAESGRVAIPQGPGLGVTLVRKTIERYRV